MIHGQTCEGKCIPEIEIAEIIDVEVNCRAVYHQGIRRDIVIMLFVLALLAMIWSGWNRERALMLVLKNHKESIDISATAIEALRDSRRKQVEFDELQLDCFGTMFKHVFKVDDEITAIKSETDYLTEVATWQQRQLNGYLDLVFDVMRSITYVGQRVTTIEKRPPILYTLRHTRCGYFLVKTP